MKDKYMKEGFASGSITAIITMIVGVGIAVLVLMSQVQWEAPFESPES